MNYNNFNYNYNCSYILGEWDVEMCLLSRLGRGPTTDGSVGPAESQLWEL